MGSLSNAYELLVNNKLWGGTDFTPPATYYFGLSTTPVAEDGSNITEPAGNGYARVALTNNATNFPTGSPKVIAVDVTFPTPTGSGWGLIVDYVIMSAASGGTMVASGALPAPQTIVAGSPPFWPAGSIQLDQD